MVVVVMGVAGCGKTVIGEGLAESLGWTFKDADSLHSKANVEKMSRGQPLTDSDRMPWLQSVAQVIDEWIMQDQNGIIGCSALKEEYRKTLIGHHSRAVKFAYLKGSYELFEKRLAQRQHHFMKSDMLKSQFETLEEPADAIVVDASLSVEEIIDFLSHSVRSLALK